MQTSWPCAILLAIFCLLSVGCRKSSVLTESTGPLTVSISRPVQREVTDYAQFIGRTEAVDAVELKARVTGYLLKAELREGAEVKAGDLLFEIDPRTYQAQVDAAKGEVQVAQTKYELAKTENERAKALYQENPRAISLKALDQHQAEEDAAAAQVVAATANMAVYELNLQFTKITSPIDGRVGRNQVGVGNLVTENATTLTTVVSQDPIYVYFNIDEKNMLDALRRIYAGKMPPLRERKVPVEMGLQDDNGFPLRGVADFANNQVDASTGTLTLRAAFENPPNKNGLRLLMPGLFVRVRLAMDTPRQSLLVTEAAIGNDQSQRFVYVVDQSNVVRSRQVTLGALQDDGLRVVKTGISADDTVIVSGLQLVRPGETVKTDLIAMPVVSSREADREETTSPSPSPSTSNEQPDASSGSSPDTSGGENPAQ